LFLVFLIGVFFAATAIYRPGLIGTVGLFVVFGAIFMVTTGYIFVRKYRLNVPPDSPFGEL
jgi:hypothetical protein